VAERLDGPLTTLNQTEGRGPLDMRSTVMSGEMVSTCAFFLAHADLPLGSTAGAYRPATQARVSKALMGL